MRFAVLFLLVPLLGCVDAPSDSACEDDKCDLLGDGHRGNPCTFNFGCSDAEGLTCRPRTRTARSWEDLRCAKPGTDGELCDDNDDCAEGLSCRPLERYEDLAPNTVFGGVCAVPAGIRDNGCDDGDDCEEGLACELTEYVSRQYESTYGRCLIPDCTYHTPCGTGRVCRPSTGHTVVNGGHYCAEPAGDGELCTLDYHCKDGLVCVEDGQCGVP